MRLAFSVTAVLMASAAPAAAVQGVLGRAADAKACFERTYDTAHLARNPTQTVTRIRISVSRESMPGNVGIPPVAFMRVELTRRGDAQARRAIAWCEHPFGGEKLNARGQVTNLGQPGARCRVTGEDHMNAEEGNDGGSVDIRAAEGGLLARLSSPLRLRTGELVSVDKGREIRLGASDRTFRLSVLPASACDDFRRAIREE
ncbi:MAG: hypothetical protein ACRCUE_18030 [Bosea sp. (in: a-proteobacteria)]